MIIYYIERYRYKQQSDDVISNVEANHDSNNNNNEDFEPISDFALKEMAMELMFAGYFTSGSALTSCVLELARHPDVFRKVEDEFLEHGLLKDSKDDEYVELDLKVIHQLTYTEQVLKETLRVRPPVLGGYRVARKTFQLGVRIFQV